MSFKRLLALAMCIFSIANFAAADEGKPLSGADMSAADFLNVARRPPNRECWARLDGTAINMRRGAEEEEPREAQIHLGILFTPERTLAALVFDKVERYEIGQSYKASGGASVEAMPIKGGAKPRLGDFGLRAEDLTMSFIFWKFKEELKVGSVKGKDCRVFLLESPDAKESVKVYVSVEYFFPLKVEWFKPGDKEPYRTLEIVSFRREEDFWVVSELKLEGPGWRTMVDFDESSAGYSKDGVPKDIFLGDKE